MNSILCSPTAHLELATFNYSALFSVVEGIYRDIFRNDFMLLA